MKPSVVALIPARGGSVRVPGKNIRPLGGHPAIAYTIRAAVQSGVFSSVIVSTDDEKTAEIARQYGAEVPFMRPVALAGALSPDIEWIEFTLTKLKEQGRVYDAFALLRPTSPFRSPDTIKRAWAAFTSQPGVDSLRAVEKCHEHPCKMWVIRQNRLLPLIPFGPESQPWHSTPYQALPEVYVQNASLEIAWVRAPLENHTIAGATMVPFLTEGYEGFDINNQDDWELAEKLLADGRVKADWI
ncbi:MAG: acylneuraminate cytidylyltransferase family protein [Nitrospinae bacterium]|nr:acylneuraminate cytidylyltransferase family protein [Nitrospinota bacterium]